jgi:hypothetical protein
MAHLPAAAPWISGSNSALDTIWDLLWHLYTGRVDTTCPGGISVGGYPSGGCIQGTIAFSSWKYLRSCTSSRVRDVAGL